IYGLSSKDYLRLEPYISIVAEEKTKPDKVTASVLPIKEEKNAIVELNTTDSSQLTALNGIGSVLSSRILKFRDRLGGFTCVEQLKEVYGLSPETFDEIKTRVTADSSMIKKIDINTIILAGLKTHPYFRNPFASTLISYREQNG